MKDIRGIVSTAYHAYKFPEIVYAVVATDQPVLVSKHIRNRPCIAFELESLHEMVK